MTDPVIPPTPSMADLQKEIDDLNAWRAAHTRPGRMVRTGLSGVWTGTKVATSWAWNNAHHIAGVAVIVALLGVLVNQHGCNLPGPSPVPPGPVPVPVPPAPTPAPIVGDGLQVLIVYESADQAKLTKDQQAVLFGKSFRDYLGASCIVGPDGKTKQYRIYDKDVTGETKMWADAMARPRTSLPWLIASNGKTGFEGPVTTEADARAKIDALKGK